MKPSEEPKETATVEPSEEPKETTTVMPSEEPVVEATITPTVQCSTEPTIVPTESQEENLNEEINVKSEIISKVEEKSILVADGTTTIALTENVKIVKKVSEKEVEITKEEIFAGDQISVLYNGTENSDLPTILDDCIKIIVESSEKTVVEKTKIDSVNSYSGGRFSLFVENPGVPLWYQKGTTKVIKDGEEIPFSELKEGDIIRISYIHDDGSDETDEDGNKLVGFTDYISVIVVLSETES